MIVKNHEQRRLHPRLASGRDKTIKSMKKYICLIIILIIGIGLGNRVFNHIDAWLGVLIIAATIIYFCYKLLITKPNNEKVD